MRRPHNKLPGLMKHKEDRGKDGQKMLQMFIMGWRQIADLDTLTLCRMVTNRLE